MTLTSRAAAAAVLFGLLLLAPPATAQATRYGTVQFANSGAPAAQADFQAGVALLHDFEYPAAAAAFRRAQAIDPGFAMAYWGEAMTHNHAIWMEQDLAQARAVLARLGATPAERRAKAKTPREQAFLGAVEVLYGQGSKPDRDRAYEAAMAALHAAFPDDVEAIAFHALAVLGTAHGGRDVATYMRAAAMLEEAWPANREHPGVLHYLIHCYDDPDHAPLGLRAARLYAKVAPDAGHASHMTSHIFLALGMWQETVEANLAGIAAANRMRGSSEPRCGHYLTWLSYAYLQLGDTASATRAVQGCAAHVARAPEAAPSQALDTDDSRASSLANMRLRYLVETGAWDGEVARMTLPVNAGPLARLDFVFADLLRAVGRRDPAAAAAAQAALAAAAKDVVALATAAADEDPTSRERPGILLLQAEGLLAEARGHGGDAERAFREAARREAALPVAFGPPTIDKPSEELLAEFLVRQGRRAEARDHFARVLLQAPGRRVAEQGLAAAR